MGKDKKKKVIAAGHICIDITPVFPKRTAGKIEEILLPGKLVRTEGVSIHTGGAVANTGLAMKLFGNDVSLMGKIGDDGFGKIIQNMLESYGAGEGLIVSAESTTSYSVVLAIPGIDRIFLHDPGANETFCADDLDMERVRQADLFHFGYPPLMKKLYEHAGEGLASMLRQVQEENVPVSMDMAAIDAGSDAAKEDWHEILKRALPYVDFFVPSAEELCFMMDRERYNSWNDRAAGRDMTEVLTLEDVRPLGDLALQMGAKVVLIKCGASGIYYRTASADRLSGLCSRLCLSAEDWAGKEGFEVSYRPDAVLSGTGAGDTCIAAFLSAVLREESLSEAMHMAAAAGACCVASYDALSGLSSYEELKERIRQGWEKNEIYK